MTAPPYPQPAPQRRERPRTPGTTFILSAILTAFVLEIYTGAWNHPEVLGRWAVDGFDVFVRGQYWRLLTAMFLHGNGTIQGTLLHLAVNGFTLYQLGSVFEWRFGTRRFLFVYFATGIVASLVSARYNDGYSVGASGALFGIVGGFIASVWRSPRLRRERFTRSVMNQLVFLTIANLAIGSQIQQIDMYAHVGGLVAGLLIGAILPYHAPPPPPPAEAVIDVRPSAAG